MAKVNYIESKGQKVQPAGSRSVKHANQSEGAYSLSTKFM